MDASAEFLDTFRYGPAHFTSRPTHFILWATWSRRFGIYNEKLLPRAQRYCLRSV